MVEDARFEDAPVSDQPLRLKAGDTEDLAVISSLVQDAVGRVSDIRWMARHHRLVLLLNRFRWEDAQGKRNPRPFERVRTGLTIDGALSVKARGADASDADAVISVLALDWQAGEDGAGILTVTCAGGIELRVEAEMLDISLADLTRPWVAKATDPPSHDR